MQRCVLLVLALVAVVMLAGCGGSGGGTTSYIYLATQNLSPGKILRVDGAAEQVVLTNPSGHLTGFAFDGPTVTPPASAFDWCYFCNGVDGMQIYRADGSTVYTHTTFISDLAVGPDGALYFSESYGAGADGKIYRFNAAGVPSLFYTVALAQVHFFSGSFAFSPDGTLYISNGNTGNAGVWRCPLTGAPTEVYHRTDDGDVTGFCFTDDNTFLFTDLTDTLRRASINGTTASTVFVSPAGDEYRDVVVSSHLFPPG
jgi:WD40 repeat protein